MTVSQSSSFMRMSRPSRVTPALATTMSTWPAAASAWPNSASTAAESDRLQASTWLRSPSSEASPLSASSRVPDSTTWAPCACRALAMAPPMPPVAPVTRAVLPERSNITGAPLEAVGEGLELVRLVEAHGFGVGGDALGHAGQHLARAQLGEAGHPALAGQPDHALAPA